MNLMKKVYDGSQSYLSINQIYLYKFAHYVVSYIHIKIHDNTIFIIIFYLIICFRKHIETVVYNIY